MEKIDRLIAFLKELGFKPNIKNSFEDRLKIQKISCLLDLIEEGKGYSCGLYIRGPYSPTLAKDLYGNEHKIKTWKTSCELTKKEKEDASRIKEATNDLDVKMLEIASTYLFLVKRQNKNNKQAIIELKKLKPFYSDSQIAVGVSKSKLLFPPSEKEIKEMKEEFKAWEEAALEDAKY